MAEDNIKKLRRKLSAAGYPDGAIQNIFKYLADRGISGVSKMDNEAFNNFLENIVIPAAFDYTQKFNQAYPDKAEEASSWYTKAKSMAEPWDRKKFLNTLGRKETEIEKDGKKVKNPAHIGALSDEDYVLLHGAGLSQEEADAYAQKFRDEYIHDAIKNAESERANEIVKQNSNAQKDFAEKGWTDGLDGFATNMQRILGPELYAELYKSIGNPSEQPDTWYKWLWEHKDALGRDVMRNVNATVAFAASGGNPVAAGAMIAANDMMYNATSPNYDLNLDNIGSIAAGGMAAGTVPFAYNALSGFMSKIPSKFINVGLRNARKAIYGRTAASKAESEQARMMALAEDAKRMVEQSQVKGNLVTPVQANESVARLTEAINNSAEAFVDGTAGRWTEQSVRTALSNDVGMAELQKYLTAPSVEKVTALADATKAPPIRHRATTSPKSIAKSDAARDAKIQRANENLDWVRTQFPETFSDFEYNAMLPADKVKANMVKRGMVALNNTAGMVEPFVSRWSMSQPDEETMIDNDEDLRNYYARYNPTDSLYQEWLRKYGRDR